jgi:hypothetical protein
MAHLIKVHALDLTHDNGKDYIPILINLDDVTSIEPSKVHTIIYTNNGSAGGIRVKENLDQILQLSKNNK